MLYVPYLLSELSGKQPCLFAISACSWQHLVQLMRMNIYYSISNWQVPLYEVSTTASAPGTLPLHACV